MSGTILGPGRLRARVECARVARGFTRTELCKRTGIKPKRLRELETVFEPKPTPDEIGALCRVLDFGPRWFGEKQTIERVVPICPRWRSRRSRTSGGGA